MAPVQGAPSAVKLEVCGLASQQANLPTALGLEHATVAFHERGAIWNGRAVGSRHVECLATLGIHPSLFKYVEVSAYDPKRTSDHTQSGATPTRLRLRGAQQSQASKRL